MHATADRTAERARAPLSRDPGKVLRRRCACGGTTGPGGECAECRKKRLRRRALSGGPARPVAPPIVHDVLRSSGRALDAGVRREMEPRFGHSFADVRVHADGRAAESARAVDAHAYTVGRDVVFGAGRYAPGSAEGRRLIAHELAHVVQQRGGETSAGGSIPIGSAGDAAEREAESAASAVERGGAADVLTGSAPRLARQVDDDGGCSTSLPGFPPTPANCLAYLLNAWWLPTAYVNNATCACMSTPDSTTANCVRAFLQRRLWGTPAWVKAAAMAMKPQESNPATLPIYHSFVQAVLTPRIYQDHVDAYAGCCCSSGPAPYPAWIGVTTIPIQPCSLVGATIRNFGSCHGTPGAW